jgi:hypothetical protein
MTTSEIDTGNWHMVAFRGDRVVIMSPPGDWEFLPPERARLLAAWLVTMADVIDGQDDRFEQIRQAVRNT